MGPFVLTVHSIGNICEVHFECETFLNIHLHVVLLILLVKKRKVKNLNTSYPTGNVTIFMLKTLIILEDMIHHHRL